MPARQEPQRALVVRAGARTARTVVILALAAGITPTAAGAEDRRGIEVQPAQVETDLRGRGFSQTLTYLNHTDATQELALRLRETWNRPDAMGASAFHENPAIEQAFSIDRDTVTIPAGGKATVRLTGAIPARARAAYPAVVALLPHQDGTSVQAEYQLASTYLLRGPKPWDERIAITDVGLIPEASGSRYTVYALLKNLGDVHVRPRGRVEIRRGGELLATVAMPSNANGRPFAVLPTCDGGCSLRLQATWSPKEPVTGDLDLTARFTDPSASLTRSVHLSAGREAAVSASLAFSTVTPRELVATVRNGDGARLGHASVRFIAREGAYERGRTQIPIPALDPAEAHPARWSPEPALPDGLYEVTAELFSAGRSMAVATTTLRVGPPPAKGSRLLLVLLAALLIAVAGYLLWRHRRRRPDPPPQVVAPVRVPARAR